MKQILIITIILSIGLVSATYGGENHTEVFPFNPVVCFNEDNLSYSINNNQVTIDIPINFVGSFNITCFDNIEVQPQIEYRGSGGGSSTRTIYKNNTIYKDVYKDKIVNNESVIYVNQSEYIDKEVSKLFNKDIWFYLTMLLIIIGMALLINYLKGGLKNG